MRIALAALLCVAHTSCRTGLPLPTTDDDETAVGGQGGAPVQLEPQAVWANDETSLFTLDRETLTLSLVGSFDCTGFMTDIAADEEGRLFGVSFTNAGQTAFVEIDPDTAACEVLALLEPGLFVGSLTAFRRDSGQESLLGVSLTSNNDIRLLEFDPNADTAQTIGSFPWYPGTWHDIVATDSGELYGLMHSPEDTEGDAQHLVTIDPDSGALLEDLGALPIGSGPGGSEQIAGLAYWDGTLFGFSIIGQLYAIDPAGPTLSLQPIIGAPLLFSGAAVSLRPGP